jgi:hypothetical protein
MAATDRWNESFPLKERWEASCLVGAGQVYQISQVSPLKSDEP